MEMTNKQVVDGLTAALSLSNWVTPTVYDSEIVIDDHSFRLLAVIASRPIVDSAKVLPAAPVAVHLTLFRDSAQLPLNEDVRLLFAPAFVQHALKDYAVYCTAEKLIDTGDARISVRMRLLVLGQWYDLRVLATLPMTSFLDLATDTRFWDGVWSRIMPELNNLLVRAMPYGIEFAMQIVPAIHAKFSALGTAVAAGNHAPVSVVGDVPWSQMHDVVRLSSNVKDEDMLVSPVTGGRRIKI